MTQRCDGEQDGVRSDQVSRRSFIGSGGALVGAAALGSGLGGPAEAGPQSGSPDDDLGPIPRRVLGKTGAMVSILGLGTADMGEGPQDVKTCVAVFSEAIDRGISYVDTARIYGNAEEALGQVLKTRRDKVFLVTKCMTNSRTSARQSFETSLKKMGVDHVDLLHLHSTGDRDLDSVLSSSGAWEYLLEMKKAGKTRFLGITGHNRPHKFLRMLDTKQVDVMMVAMNFVDKHIYGFEDKVLPRAREVGTAAMAMKVYGGIRGGFSFNRQRRPSQMDPIYLQIAMRYSLSLEGVTGVVVGCHDAIELRQNIRYALHAPPLSKNEQEALRKHGERIAPAWGPRFGPAS